jgi:large subunit ribosomal protein L21
MYAVIKTGGKQYRVAQDEHLLVERLPDAEGATIALQTLLFVDGDTLVDGADLAKVKVEATIMAHERGPKLRVVKFKPKRGYKNRNGHRQDLTRIRITSMGVSGSRSRSRKAAAPKEEATEVSDGA